MPISKANIPSTQRYLDIAEIRNDCVVLKNGGFRAVLLVSSINFTLKSEDEQKAIIQGYVGFLNTLDFPLQIVIQSRPLNIKPYLVDLEQMRKKQTNELLREQMSDYLEFIRELVSLGEIMSRRFLISIPYSPLGDKKRGFFSRTSDLFSAAKIVKIKREKFEKYREALFRRVDKVISGLSGLGLKAAPLDTQSLIELFYSTYNPAESEMQHLAEVNKLRVED